MLKHSFNGIFYVISQIINVIIPIYVYRELFSVSDSLQDFAQIAVSITVAAGSKQLVDWGFSSRGVTLLHKDMFRILNYKEQVASFYGARLISAIPILFFVLFYNRDLFFILFIILSIINPNIFLHHRLKSHLISLSILVEKSIFLTFILISSESELFKNYFMFLFFAQLVPYAFINSLFLYANKDKGFLNAIPIKAFILQIGYMKQNVMNIIYSNMAVPLLSSFGNSVVVAVYFGAEKIIKALQIVSGSSIVAIGPVIQKMSQKEFRYLFYSLYFVLAIIPFVILNLFPAYIWSIAFPVQFLDEVYIVRVVSIGLLSSMIFQYNSVYFMTNAFKNRSILIFSAGTFLCFTFSTYSLGASFFVGAIGGVELMLLVISIINLRGAKEIH